MAEQTKAAQGVTKGTTRRAVTKTTARRSPRSTGAGSGRRGAAEAPEYAAIKAALERRLNELREEYDEAVVMVTDLQQSRVSDGAGDDQADTGTKTFEREQELSLVHGIRERLQQVEHALTRLADGVYGSCERCGNPIPAARLEAFPSVTLCVTCKQIEERR